MGRAAFSALPANVATMHSISKKAAFLRAVIIIRCLLPASAILLFHTIAWSHAFVNRSEPRTGVTLGESPAQIRIWFDGPIESLFSTIRVENGDKQRIDKGNACVSSSDNRLLEVGLPSLPSGRYRVFWSVIARDGHRREGDFSFLIK
jgi:copper resistance protein C